MNDDSQKSWVEKLADALLREPQTQEQLMDMLHEANDNKLIDNSALKIIEAVLGYAQLHARDVMIPRGQMIVVDADMPASLALEVITRSSHSRFPIIDQNRDQVIGILLAKDLLPLITANSLHDTLVETLARPVHIVPESKRLDNLLKDFQKKRSHMAMVADEYGGIAGLITIEDVLEQIVGDIVDETDIEVKHDNIQEIDHNTYLIQGLTPIADINNRFDCQFTDEEHDTFAGLVIKEFGYLPTTNEKISIAPFKITITQANSRRLQQCRVIYHAQDEQ